MKSSKFAVLAVLMLSLLGISGCGITRVDPAHVGIVVDLAGKNRGVQDYTISTGWVTYNPITQQVFSYPTFVQTYQFTASKSEGKDADESITFTDKNAVKINADISMSYQLDATKVPSFYVKFRNDDINTFTFGYLHNVTRTAFDTVGGKYTVEQIMGDNGPFLTDVKNAISTEVGALGVEVQQLGFIGYPRPPANITDAINQAQQAKYLAQQKQNELISAQADAAKMVAAAQGQSDANRKLAESISPQLLQWRAMDVQNQWIARWNGQRPSVEAGGTGTGFLMNLPAPK